VASLVAVAAGVPAVTKSRHALVRVAVAVVLADPTIWSAPEAGWR
jgi:hypothetical protein